MGSSYNQAAGIPWETGQDERRQLKERSREEQVREDRESDEVGYWAEAPMDDRRKKGPCCTKAQGVRRLQEGHGVLQEGKRVLRQVSRADVVSSNVGLSALPTATCGYRARAAARTASWLSTGIAGAAATPS